MHRQRPQPKPASKLPLAIGLCMLLASFGSCKGVAELAARHEPVTIALPAIPPPAEEVEEWGRFEAAWKELEEAQTEAYRQQRPMTNALAAVNLVSSLVLLFGALGTGARLRVALPSLRAGLVLSQGYVLLGLVVGTWLQLGLVDIAQEILGPLRVIEGVVGRTAGLSLFAYWLGIPLSAVMMVAQFVFYVWVQRLLQRVEPAAPPTGG